jgi:hypothetical protein
MAVTDDEVTRCLDFLRESRSLDDVIELSKRLLRRAVARKLIDHDAQMRAEEELQLAAARARGVRFCQCGCGIPIPAPKTLDGREANRRYIDAKHRDRAHYKKYVQQPKRAAGAAT